MAYFRWQVVWLSCSFIFSTIAQAQTLIQTKTMEVNAIISNGCLLNNNTANGADLGTIRLGSTLMLEEPLYAVSAINAGSIILRCTPDTKAFIALGPGNNVQDITAGRKLKEPFTGATLVYQLYQDAGYTKVWGNNMGNNTLSIEASGKKDTYPIYVKVMPVNFLPKAGEYRDTVMVTVTY